MKLADKLKRAKTGAEWDRIVHNASQAKKSPNMARITQEREGLPAIAPRPEKR